MVVWGAKTIRSGAITGPPAPPWRFAALHHGHSRCELISGSRSGTGSRAVAALAGRPVAGTASPNGFGTGSNRVVPAHDRLQAPANGVVAAPAHRPVAAQVLIGAHTEFH